MNQSELAQRNERFESLKTALQERILLLDGAVGTYLQDLELTADDFGGLEFEGCNEVLVDTRPAAILGMHRAYLEAGADIIETNTFGGTPLVLGEFGLAERAYELNKQAAQLARQAAAEHTATVKPAWVAGSIGPTTKAITVTGGITFAQLQENFYTQAAGLVDGGVDYLLVETSQDTRNVKAALLGIEQVCQERGLRVPVAISCTIEPMGTMLAGQGVEAFYASVIHFNPLYLGMNCATGPAFMTDHLRTLSTISRVPLAVMPNAGLPDEDGIYLETPALMTSVLARFIEEGWVNVVGGCCGTTPEHIRAFRTMLSGAKPRVAASTEPSFCSGIDYLELTDELRPILVGERTNAVGSRLFKRLIVEGKFDEASDIARRQVNGGAQIIDINLANPDQDEVVDMHAFMERVIQKIKTPIMIDSTDTEVIATALPYCQGKAIINSINLEDGEERFESVLPLVRQYGAMVVVGTIDEDPEQGMGVTRQRKLEIALRCHDLLTNNYGIAAEDIIFDPLVFPCATGDEQYIGSAEETIEGLRLIKQALPRCKTVLGVSNVSFGLPPAGREVLNSVYLYHCVRAGLDLAIVNSEKLERYASIPAEEKLLADNLLFNRGEDPIGNFANHFRDRTGMQAVNVTEGMSLDERLAHYIIAGSKDGLVEDLEEKRMAFRPLEIINGPLMTGMDEVGRLFNDNKLIVAEVLQSAEAMKAAVAHLEQFMEKDESTTQGSMLLATVRGDVHDIGKNLVDIIFTNNGYRVINLGIKVAPETLIRAVKEHSPDLIGLSGLLVKSAQQMVVTAQDLKVAGVTPPMLVGGAALSRNFTQKKIAPAYGGMVAYASDAMSGLTLANRIMDPEERPRLALELIPKEIPEATTTKKVPAKAPSPRRSPSVRIDLPIPTVPDLERHVMQELSLDEVWSFLNPMMLYGKHLGLRGNYRRLMDKKDAKAVELTAVIEELKHLCRGGWMRSRAMWRFFPATSAINRLTLYAPESEAPLEVFDFPRQAKLGGLALADFVLPPDGDHTDHVAFLVTTAGEGIREHAEKLKDEGRYLMSHALHALALETAEAAAEWVHARIRTMWGFPDPASMTMTQRFQAKYRGKRYSFGYPACPDLSDQEKLWSLLDPDHIGVSLTEGHMMDPEASVSALVLHHPDAKYFSAGVEEAED